MDFNLIAQQFTARTPLSPEELQAIFGAFKEVKFKRREMITYEGQVEQYLYLVLEGVQRSFFDHKEKEVTFQFTYPYNFTGIPDSFLTQTPSRFNLQCLTASKLLRISYTQFREMNQQYPNIAKWHAKELEQLIYGLVEKQMELMAFDAKERFKIFMQRSAHVFQLIPQKYIASYLGMTPETFSVMLKTVPIK